MKQQSSQRRSRKAQPLHAHGATADQVDVSKRALFVFFLLGCVMLVVAARLFYVQVVRGEELGDAAERQHIQEQSLAPERGTIHLQARDGGTFPVAVSREYFTAFLSPRDIDPEDHAFVATRVHELFGMSMEDVHWKLSKRDDVYEVVGHKVTRSQRAEIAAEDIPGLHFRPERRRYYPGESLASHVVGFVGFDDAEGYRGRYGVEASFDDVMTGRGGVIQEVRTARGGWNTLFDRILAPGEDGADIVLTIDQIVQGEVERVLAEDAERYGAERASAIVMDVDTGAIVALANVPTFSPNTYGTIKDISLYKNASISDAYESGSVYKTFTLAMGLDAGKITPQTTYVDPGVVQIGGYSIKNAEEKTYGLQTMAQVLEESINTGVIHVERLLGNAAFKEYTEQFGFGVPTGIPLPAEASGNLSNLRDTRRTIEYYTASYGQGFTATPLQLITAYSALANGGTLLAPQIIERIIAADGTETTIDPVIVRRVISEQASTQISEMLQGVVDSGHAALAAVPGYAVGGKTGTAQVVNPETGTYDEDRKNTTFVGYAPIDDPRYAVLVKYENPVNVEWAATSAAPTFGRIMRFLLPYYHIPQTEDVITRTIPDEDSIID